MNDKSEKDAEAANLQDVCDYIIWKINAGGARLNILKLHKLMYYVQAWHLAFGRGPCFNSSFQAWVHGPVCRPIYDRFKDTKSMYSAVRSRDLREDFNPADLPKKVRRHIDSILEAYADFTDDQLEEMTHRERPWIKAREGYDAKERCEEPISDQTMASYYGGRLKRDGNKA
jgi:uncharacterized phage-associated protein